MKLALGLALLLVAPAGYPSARADGSTADPGADVAQAYAIDTSASTTSVVVGDRGKIVLVIRARAPTWHVHPQAPLKVRLEASRAVKIEKPELTRRDVVDPKAEAPRFEVPFLALAAGTESVRANVDFFVCSDTACVRQVRALAIPIAVRGAGPR